MEKWPRDLASEFQREFPTSAKVPTQTPKVHPLAAEIGSQTGHIAELERCDQRFEIEIDDLAAALDEINTLMEVQGFLQDATRGILFTCWNGNLLPPET